MRFGLDAELVGAEEVLTPDAGRVARLALRAPSGCPATAYVDPHIATYAVASAARELGVTIRTQTFGRRDRRARRRRRRGRDRERADRGRDRRETRAGMWAPRIAAMVGSFRVLDPGSTISTSRSTRSRGTSSRARRRAFRDTPTISSTGRAESGGSALRRLTSRTPSRGGTTACRASTGRRCSRPTPRDSSS